MLGAAAEHDFAGAHQTMIDQRESAIEAARSRIGGGDALRTFNEALVSCQRANFAWWNDEHNFYIDQRTQIPAHWITHEIGKRLADGGQLREPDDVFWLFTAELMQAIAGDGVPWSELRTLVQPRKDYYAEWRPKAAQMPQLLGTVPEAVADPVLLEIFGLYPRYLEATRRGGRASTELRGLPASRGVVEGTARVLSSVAEIGEITAGDILVCKATTPDWTPVFGTLLACVCDSGGSLTHAAIVSREYGIPCVVGTATATRVIQTGDRIRVDGNAGTVTRLT
jgi:pyruvate,water dikinase